MTLDWHNWFVQLQGVGLVALAALFGGVIGVEREIARKPAGVRTHIFVAGAAALFMVLGRLMIDRFAELEGVASVAADPVRITQAIVVGISFLGAGTIVRQAGDRVEGLTTAASILLVAAVGIATAMGLVVIATGVTVLSLPVLVVLGWVEERVLGRQRG